MKENIFKNRGNQVSLASPQMPLAESLQSPATIAPSSNEDKVRKKCWIKNNNLWEIIFWKNYHFNISFCKRNKNFQAAKSISKMSVSNKQDQPPVSQNEASNQAQAQGGDSRVRICLFLKEVNKSIIGRYVGWFDVVADQDGDGEQDSLGRCWKGETRYGVCPDDFGSGHERIPVGWRSGRIPLFLKLGKNSKLQIDLNIVHEDAALLPLANECFEKSVGCTIARLVPAPQGRIFSETIEFLKSLLSLHSN